MDVNQIFKDLAVMIHDQGEMIGELQKPRSDATFINGTSPVRTVSTAPQQDLTNNYFSIIKYLTITSDGY